MKQTFLHCLPDHLQNYIHSLCAIHTYDKVVQILALPHSEGGVHIKTSRSALSRFVTSHNPIPEQSEALGQIARAMLLRCHTSDQEILSGLISLVQRHLFHKLTLDKVEVEELFPQFRLLHRLHNDLFRLDKRKAEHDGALRAEYEEMKDPVHQSTPDCEQEEFSPAMEELLREGEEERQSPCDSFGTPEPTDWDQQPSGITRWSDTFKVPGDLRSPELPDSTETPEPTASSDSPESTESTLAETAGHPINPTPNPTKTPCNSANPTNSTTPNSIVPLTQLEDLHPQNTDAEGRPAPSFSSARTADPSTEFTKPGYFDCIVPPGISDTLKYRNALRE